MAARRSTAPVHRKPTLSPTRIGMYLECALKYRCVYIDRIGRFYMRAQPGYSFGSTLHRVLQGFHKEGGVGSGAELLAALDAHWISAGYESAEEERAHQEAAREIVGAYRDAQSRQPATETLATEKTVSWDLGRFRLSGRIDRIERHADGALQIIDYKSGRTTVTPEEVGADLAMSCYQLILRRLYPDAQVFATIYCLRSNVSASAELSPQELDDFEGDVRELGREILDRDYESLVPVPVRACEWCEFISRCMQYRPYREAISLRAADSDSDDPTGHAGSET